MLSNVMLIPSKQRFILPVKCNETESSRDTPSDRHCRSSDAENNSRAGRETVCCRIPMTERSHLHRRPSHLDQPPYLRLRRHRDRPLYLHQHRHQHRYRPLYLHPHLRLLPRRRRDLPQHPAPRRRQRLLPLLRRPSHPHRRLPPPLAHAHIGAGGPEDCLPFRP